MTDAEKQALKDEIVRERGYWAPFHAVLLERDPDFLKAYIAFQAAPSRSGVLPQKLCEFIYIAIDTSVNHMYERGGRRHMEFALKAGASEAEVLQVILLTTVLAAHHPIDLGLAILADRLGAQSARSLLDAVPELARGYDAYHDAVWECGPLSRKEKELVALAVCAAPTCLHEPGMRRHIDGALEAGATAAEIAAVLQLAAALAIHTCTIAVPGFDDVVNGKTVGAS